MAIRGEHVESCKPISAIFDYTHVMLKASSYSSCRTPSVPQPDSVIFLPLRHLSSMEPILPYHDDEATTICYSMFARPP